jgi:superfamily I DNA/RNA helicase
LIGPDRDEFLKGRRCENQGLGVGAFIYYRRVVENQKDRIIGEIIKVSEKIGASEEKLEKLRNAIKETQFSKALSVAKDAMPESLLINGHSPILLLHSALSEGVHALSDEECLELAGSVRVVLGELSERLSQALKDEAELAKALSTLMHKKNG